MSIVVSGVEIYPPGEGSPPNLLCYAAVTLNSAFRVNGVRLVEVTDEEGREVKKVFFPDNKKQTYYGHRYYEYAHPVNGSTRDAIEFAVRRAYEQWKGGDDVR